MIKISGRVKKENANALKSIARFFYRQRDWGNLEIVVNRVEKLQPKNQKLTSNSLLQRWLPQFIRGVEWAIGTILLGLVLLLSNILGDLVKGQWLVSLQTWAMAHPWLLLFLTSGVILLSGVLALGLKAINQASDVQGEKK